MEVGEAVGGELDFFAADEVHITEGADLVLADV